MLWLYLVRHSRFPCSRGSSAAKRSPPAPVHEKMEHTALFDSELEQLEKSIRSCSMSPLQANRRRRNLARTPRGSPMTARSRPFAQRHRAAHAIESSPAMEQPPVK